MNNSESSLMSQEFKVGLMVVAAGIILMVAILFVNNYHFASEGRVIHVRFNFLGDLKSNAPVEYAGGIKVGAVEDIRFEDNKAVVDLLITEKKLRLRKDSKVCIYSAGLLGSRYVQIGADLGTGEEVNNGDTLDGVDANNLDLTFSELGDVLETFEKMLADPKSKENFLHSLENMNKTTDSLLALVVSSREKVERILDDLSKSSGKSGKIVDSFQNIAKSLDSLTASLDKKDVNEAVKNLESTLKIMNQMAKNLQDGKGTLGVLLQDQKTADDIKSLVEELKAHPWRLLWKK